jgi:WD40 repeat protein
VAFTAANKAMDAGSRSAAKFSRCAVGDGHLGIVLDVVWDGANAVSAGGDGRVKIWDPKNTRCVWTSEARAPDECIKVASNLGKGLVAGAMRSGEIVVWSNLALDIPISANTFTIPSPTQDASHEISGLFIDTAGALLVTFEDNALFYRFDVDLSTGAVECTKFGDQGLGAITSVAPFFTNQPGEYSLVITGTQLGCVGIYDWTSSNPLPTYKFEAYEDGASVTALAWNGVTLVTGCARGTTRVWDALTLEHLRSFPSPVPRQRTVIPGAPAENPAVRQILLGLEKEVLLVAVGDRVMAWRAGPVPRGGYKTKGTPGKKKGRAVTSKYHRELCSVCRRRWAGF